jgi:hypothetical protein
MTHFSPVTALSARPHFQGATTPQKKRSERSDAMDVLRTADIFAKVLKASAFPKTVSEFVTHHRFSPQTAESSQQRLMQALRAVARLAQDGDKDVLKHPGYDKLAKVLDDLRSYPNERTKPKRGARQSAVTAPKPAGTPRSRVAPHERTSRGGEAMAVSRGRVSARGRHVDRHHPRG